MCGRSDSLNSSGLVIKCLSDFKGRGGSSYCRGRWRHCKDKFDRNLDFDIYRNVIKDEVLYFCRNVVTILSLMKERLQNDLKITDKTLFRRGCVKLNSLSFVCQIKSMLLLRRT